MENVLLLYSGGLDTSCMVPWLGDHYDAQVTTLTLDLGQGGVEEAREKALMLGAVEAHVIDAREAFADEFLKRAIRANGLYQDAYPLGTALARPLMAEQAVAVANEVGADAVAHGCTGKGNDQVRFEVSLGALAPHLGIIAPVRQWNLDRKSEVAYARGHGIPVPPESTYSVDANLWGRSIECGVLEDPFHAPPHDVYEMCVPPEEAPNEPEMIELDFVEGVPVALDGVTMPLVDLIEALNERAGHHGVGIVDMTEDRTVGLKSREIYESPAATVFLTAHRDLERFCSTIHENEFKALVDRRWAELVYKGLWHDPVRESLDAAIASVNATVTGTVRVKLYKGQATVVGRASGRSIYDHGLATYDEGQTFDQQASEGFIKIWGLPTRVARRRQQQQDAESAAEKSLHHAS